MSAVPAVQLENLSKTYQVRRTRGAGWRARLADMAAPRTERVVAVDRLSFSIEPGERVAFIGPNGAGKSTTLKMLAGILEPDGGRARVLGLEPTRQRRQLAFQIGTVFGQRSQLWQQLPPRETFGLLGHVYERDMTTHRRHIDSLTDTFALHGLLDTPVRQLSLGERMRCEIVASLLHRPRMLFLDEPTIGLDVSAKTAIQSLLRSESLRDGVTLVLTSHDTGDIEAICDRVIVINDGRLIWDGSLDDLRRRFLTTKRVTIFSEVEHLVIDLPGVKVVARSPYRVECEVTSSQASVGHVVDAALRHGALRDLTVEDAPLDAVIRALYAEARAGDAATATAEAGDCGMSSAREPLASSDDFMLLQEMASRADGLSRRDSTSCGPARDQEDAP